MEVSIIFWMVVLSSVVEGEPNACIGVRAPYLSMVQTGDVSKTPVRCLKRWVSKALYFIAILQLVTRRSGDSFWKGEMSRNDRKRSSKWDLKEDSRLPPEILEDDTWHGKAGREPFVGSRGSYREDNISEDRGRNLKAITEWGGDGSYGMKMSPGLDEWRRQKRSHSPENGWNRSRSRSRSPAHGFRRDSVIYDKGRSRSRESTQLCKDFASGKCRRGNHCPFLHQGNKSYEDNQESRHRKGGASKYSTPNDTRESPMRATRHSEICSDFLKGNCRRGASCRYAHENAADGFGKGSGHEYRERGNESKSRDATFEREPHRNAGIPCKFFAAGNCRNGKYCRFSHHDQPSASPDRRQWGDIKGLGRKSDVMDQVWTGPNWSDTTNVSEIEKSHDDRNGKRGPTESVQSWEGPKWSDKNTAPDINRWGDSLDNQNPVTGDIKYNHEALDSGVKTDLPWKPEIPTASRDVSHSGVDDMDMFPVWDYGSKSSNHAMKEEHGRILPVSQPIAVNDFFLPPREVSAHVHDATRLTEPMISEKAYLQQDHSRREDGAVVQSDRKDANDKKEIPCIDLNFSTNILPKKSYDQNSQSSSTSLPSGSNLFEQNQGAFSAERGEIIKHQQDQALFHDEKLIAKPDIVDASTLQVNSGIPQIQNMVTGEQLTKISDISASLAQLLGNGKQLPQLYAALNSHNSSDMNLSANPERPVEQRLAISVHPNPAIESQKQYDHLLDIAGALHDIESRKIDKSTGINHVRQSNQLNQPEPTFDTAENKKPQELHDNGPSDKIDKDGMGEEGKKSKDVKGIRAFKFALVEFVKELLKPTWKEGQVDKEAYKTIVKKVVDKVTGTMQGANIPQTQEKIDQYLSFSKPKLTKLVQAYVEKTQKG